MFTVKKVHRCEYMHVVIDDIAVGTASGWTVVDSDGIPIFHKNPYTGKAGFSVFDRKGTAQMQADWANRNADKIELMAVIQNPNW